MKLAMLVHMLGDQQMQWLQCVHGPARRGGVGTQALGRGVSRATIPQGGCRVGTPLPLEEVWHAQDGCFNRATLAAAMSTLRCGKGEHWSEATATVGKEHWVLIRSRSCAGGEGRARGIRCGCEWRGLTHGFRPYPWQEVPTLFPVFGVEEFLPDRMILCFWSL